MGGALRRLAWLLMALCLLACDAPGGRPDASVPAAGVEDPHSFANTGEVTVEHLDLELTVDFAGQSLAGKASWRLANPGAGELVLDTRDLDVDGVTLDGGAPAAFELGEEVPHLGRPLRIALAPGTETVEVEYRSRPREGRSSAVQWLTPEQTAGGEHPFLFTQSQAILARTWVPCQDTPAVRFTYDATVRVPPGLLALMSAENPTAPAADGVHSFTMPQAIPSYLLALAVGELEFRPLGPRSGVYAEPSVVERAAWEFADTEAMMAAVEKLYGPYRWGRYDVLVLPPSFPFGGMENPRLTFATPTVLAGDRSLVALVAHELAHSWSGNLVTNASWNDFWLNEGFTVYLERRVMEEVEGRPYAEMLALLGRGELEAAFAELGTDHPDTRLRLDLAGRDPDEGAGTAAYEKGYFLLRRLEEHAGRERFDAFLRGWFDAHAFRSSTTAQFLDHLRATLLAGEPDFAESVRRRWIDGTGLPVDAPSPVSPAFVEVEREVARWSDGTPARELATGDWSTHEWLHFLRSLPEPLDGDRMAELDAAFGLSASGNSEILNAWLHQVIANRWEPAYPALERFLTGMGRLKFLAPLYRRLAASDEGLARAREIYARARPTYHPLAVAAIDALLDDDESP